MEFQNKVAVVTGASSGIGWEIARELVSRGMKVYSLSRRVPENVVDGVNYLQADISKEAEVAAAVTQIPEQVDLLVNNAGVMRRGHYWEIDEKDFDLVWGVDVKGVWLVFKHLRGKLALGSITVQINSKNSLIRKADTFAYTLSKLADLEIDRLVAKDRADLDMRVAHFGPVDTVLEWTGYSAEQKAEKMKIALTAGQSAQWVMKLLESDKKALLYDGQNNQYRLE